MAWETTPQGYIKTVARVTKGTVLEYLGHEIGLKDSRVNQTIKVNRTIEELSKPETLKSFEGMPLTITHPDDKEVNAGTWGDKAVGHIQNVRVDGNYIICDAYIQDKNAIELLKDKDIRELSVGYEPADIQENGGKFYHQNIRANHVAIVAEGRAGSDCRLQDSKQKRSGFAMKGIKGLLAFIKGKKLNDEGGTELTAEEIQELIASLELALAESTDEEAKKDLQAQIDDLKAQLEKAKEPVNDEGAPADDVEALKAENAALKAENEGLKAENETLKKELEDLKGSNEASATMADAKAKFPKVNLTDAKSAKDIRVAVLVDHKIYTKEEAAKLTDSEIRAAYAGLKASTAPKIGKKLLDSKGDKPTKTASQRLGGGK